MTRWGPARQCRHMEVHRIRAFTELCVREGKGSEPKSVNLSRSPGIDSQPSGSLLQPYFTYWLARLHRLAESIPWNRFLDSHNLNKFGLRLSDQDKPRRAGTSPLSTMSLLSRLRRLKGVRGLSSKDTYFRLLIIFLFLLFLHFASKWNFV